MSEAELILVGRGQKLHICIPSSFLSEDDTEFEQSFRSNKFKDDVRSSILTSCALGIPLVR